MKSFAKIIFKNLHFLNQFVSCEHHFCLVKLMLCGLFWPKSRSGLPIRCNGKTWMNFLANPIIFFFFFQFYWEIDICHSISLRCRTWWCDLHILWNSDHNRFSRPPSSHTTKRKERRKKLFSPCNVSLSDCFLLVMWLLALTRNSPMYHIALLTVTNVCFLLLLIACYLHIYWFE